MGLSDKRERDGLRDSGMVAQGPVRGAQAFIPARLLVQSFDSPFTFAYEDTNAEKDPF